MNRRQTINILRKTTVLNIIENVSRKPGKKIFIKYKKVTFCLSVLWHFVAERAEGCRLPKYVDKLFSYLVLKTV